VSIKHYKMAGITTYLFFFFGGTGVLTQSLIIARQALLLLEPHFQPFCDAFFFQDRVSQTICLVLALNCGPPDTCLLGGYDYRCETLVPSTTHLLITLNANGLNSLIKRHRLVD
jgi:hypothetical protein